MAVRKRKYPSGKTAWVVDLYNADGRRVKKSFALKSQAAKYEAHLKRKVFEENVLGIVDKKEIEFNKFALMYLSWAQANYKPHSYEVALTAVKMFCLSFGDAALSKIALVDVEKWKVLRMKTVMNSTINRNLNTLKKMFSLAEDWGYRISDSCRKIKALKGGAQRVRYLSIEEYIRLKENIQQPYLDVAVEIALCAGLRKSEVLGLRWSDIDFKNGFIHLEKTKTGVRRSVPISAKLKKILRNWRECVEGDSLFYVRDCRRAFSGTIRRANIMNFHFHDLRHTFASYLAMEGKNLLTIASLLGHSSIGMVMRYAHLSQDHRQQAVNDIAGKLIVS